MSLGLLAAAPVARAAGAKTHEVVIENMQFTPATVTVKRGERVVWVNKDLFPHTVTAPKGFDSKPIAANAQWTYAPAKPGRYDYVCTLHPTMKGVLVVE